MALITSFIIVVFAAKIDRPQSFSNDSTSQKTNEIAEQIQKPVEPTSESEYENVTNLRAGGGGGGGSRPRNNTATINTNSAVLFLPIVYFIVAN